MTETRVLFTYNGEMSNQVLSKILHTLESEMLKLGEKPPFVKKFNTIIIECAQNLYHHADKARESGDYYSPSISVFEEGEHTYRISTTNLVHKDASEKLKNYIDFINNMTKEEQKAYYQQILTNGQISERGGGGLGIINMARRAKDSQLSYSFDDYNVDHFLFTLSFII